MSARKKVAREAVFDAMIEHGPDGHTDGHDKITDAALTAADSVMFREAAIERAAKAMATADGWTQLDWEMIPTRFNPWMARARAVVSALREEA